MLATRFTRLLGCRLPVQQAAMGGGVTTVDMVAAVATAGGLGMLHRSVATDFLAVADDLQRRCADAAGAWGINVTRPGSAPDPDRLREQVEEYGSRARIVEFFWDAPDAALVDAAHRGGALAAWQVGSTEDACAAVDAGCDLVVAQGVEAGGHVCGEMALLPLLAAVLDAVDIPVIAAGGVTTARSLAAVLAAGADAARLGTRLVASAESGAHPAYVTALLEADGTQTVVTTAFSVGWPDAPHRVLRSAVDRAAASSDDVVGIQRVGGEDRPVVRWHVSPPTREFTGDVSAMALYAGQGVGAVNTVERSADIVRTLVDGAEDLLRRW